MKTTADYLDALRVRYSLPSDYALAKMLEESRFRISNYRTGKATFSDDMAFKVADLLDLPRAEVFLSIQAERAAKQKNVPVYDVLADALRRLGGIAAAALLTFYAFSPTDAASGDLQNITIALNGVVRPQFDNNMDYAKSLILILLILNAFSSAPRRPISRAYVPPNFVDNTLRPAFLPSSL